MSRRCSTPIPVIVGVSALLAKARPNFYFAVLAWNYRRHVLAQMPVKRSQISELAYTKRKIESNISNFSAWHQRSKVLTTLWDSGKLDKAKAIEEGMCTVGATSGNSLIIQSPAEFDLVRNAMYTDPNDQSVWIYHRWLVGSGEYCELAMGTTLNKYY